MAPELTVPVIRGDIGREATLERLTPLAGSLPVEVTGSVLYPYRFFEATAQLPRFVGRRPLAVGCLVDGVNGLATTSDAFATEDLPFRGERLLATEVRPEDARHAARRTVTHRLGKRTRAIMPFDVELADAGVVYRRFWIVTVGHGRVMVDSVTGNVQPLQSRVA